MKKLLLLFLASVLAIIIDGWPLEKRDPHSILMAVLNSEKTFITKNDHDVLLKNYIIGDVYFDVSFVTNPSDYSFVDFDNDGADELVVRISDNWRNYLILRCDGLDVYGYETGIRAMQNLKKDGSFKGSSGADVAHYCRMTFKRNSYTIECEAVKDDLSKVYELHGEVCTVEEIDEFIRGWNAKENVEWLSYKDSLN